MGLLVEMAGTGILKRTDLAPLAAFTALERALLGTALSQGVNAPLTSSAGRLFDAVAALLDLCQRWPVPEDVDAIIALEDKGDAHAREVVNKLNKSFVTPMDREDIHSLVVLMDDILDLFQKYDVVNL